MYLKMDGYFLKPQQDAVIDLYNGTFDKSENVIDRDRMLDVSLLGNGVRTNIAEGQWSEKDSITKLHFTTGNAGTWVAGISTKARNIAMDAEAFNRYLKHDGIKDMLAERERDGTLNNAAVESYAKHVKTIFQVGDKKTKDWETPLGYPIEFVPMQNPYDVYSGGTLEVKLLRNGQPLPNQLVYADYVPSKNGHSHTNETHTHQDTGETHSHEEEAHTHDKAQEHSHDENNTSDHTHTTGQELRTDSEGIVTVDLTDDGIWYLRTIHLETTQDAGLTHKSNWTTLTFEVTHDHTNTQSEHAHEHQHEEGFPAYLFGIISLVVIAGLFVYYRRQKNTNA